MARKVDTGRLDRIRDAIIEYPEQKAGGYARLLGYDNKEWELNNLLKSHTGLKPTAKHTKPSGLKEIYILA